jgi:cytidylate kinase
VKRNHSESGNHSHVIAIDGPAAAGKSTVAKLVADRLDALLFDTGVLYRAVALLAVRHGTSPDDAVAVAELAREAHIEIVPASVSDGHQYDVRLNGEDVTWELRRPGVGAIVSEVSEHQDVRTALFQLQRKIVEGNRVVMVGRDIGTVIVPDAGLKIFLDATPAERARRRHQEARARGSTESFSEVLEETRHRDELDRGREAAPLRAAEDAITIDTDRLSIEEVVRAVESIARSLRGPDGKSLWPT